jgi:hypothetical protein
MTQITCPFCRWTAHAKNHVAQGVIGKCPKCQAVFTPLAASSLEDTYRFVLPEADNTGCPPESWRGFSFCILGPNGAYYRQGWFNPQTKRITKAIETETVETEELSEEEIGIFVELVESAAEVEAEVEAKVEAKAIETIKVESQIPAYAQYRSHPSKACKGAYDDGCYLAVVRAPAIEDFPIYCDTLILDASDEDAALIEATNRVGYGPNQEIPTEDAIRYPLPPGWTIALVRKPEGPAKKEGPLQGPVTIPMQKTYTYQELFALIEDGHLIDARAVLLYSHCAERLRTSLLTLGHPEIDYPAWTGDYLLEQGIIDPMGCADVARRILTEEGYSLDRAQQEEKAAAQKGMEQNEHRAAQCMLTIPHSVYAMP